MDLNSALEIWNMTAYGNDNTGKIESNEHSTTLAFYQWIPGAAIEVTTGLCVTCAPSTHVGSPLIVIDPGQPGTPSGQGDPGGSGGGPTGGSLPQAPTPQQKYQQCMAAFNNSTVGKAVSFFSVLNIPSNLSEWLGFGSAKAIGVHALDKAEASSAVTEYSITGGTATDAAVLTGSKILGTAGLFLMAGATAVDMDVRATCSGNPPVMGPIAPPIFP